MKKFLVFTGIEETPGVTPQTMQIEVKSQTDAKNKWKTLKPLLTLPTHYEAYYLISYTTPEGKPSRKTIIERR